MYQPRAFKQDSPEFLHGLIHHHPFATLVASTANGISVNHIPMLLDLKAGSNGVLQGHLARPNPLVNTLKSNLDAVAIFQGTDSYITPSWYPSKIEHGKVVPTWNYAVVHVRGVLTLKDDPVWLHELVTKLTDHQEQNRNPSWKVSDAPDDFISDQLKAIVGIEIEITSFEGKCKASQNKLEKDREGVNKGLAEESMSNPLTDWALS